MHIAPPLHSSAYLETQEGGNQTKKIAVFWLKSYINPG